MLFLARKLATVFLAVLGLLLAFSNAHAKDWQVSHSDEFRSALGQAANGDQILLAPGVYRGAFHATKLAGVTIRSSDANAPAVIDATGAGEGLKLSQASRVKISNLVVENASANGISIDDGGFERLSNRIVLRNVVVRSGGGHAIKLAGVEEFLIDSVTLSDWGNGHAGFNLIGVHRGIVQHCLVRRTSTSGGFGIKVEGGSSDVAIRANRFEESGERAIQMGGGVGIDPFRARTSSGATAERITAEGNVIVNRGADRKEIRAAVAFIGARDVEFRHNLVFRPGVFVGRVLHEGNHPTAEQCGKRLFAENVIIWYDGDFLGASPFNVGPNTFPESLQFRGNHWLNLSPHASSEVRLPIQEWHPRYGVDPGFRPDRPIAWEFDWGTWVVNATSLPQVFQPDHSSKLLVATPSSQAQFGPSLSRPLIGRWRYTDFPAEGLELAPMSSAVLVSQGSASVE